MCVFGTRPEAIKICPLVLEMKKRSYLDVRVCVTAQHRQMLDQVLTTFGVVPDYDLNIMKDRQTLFDITTNVLNGIKSVLKEVKPDAALVHGDTSTTFVTALACFYLQISVGHVEAGLRTYNIYNLGGHNEKANIEIVKIILKELEKPESLITFVADRKGHDQRYAIDPSKAVNELGWAPTTMFVDGIKKTIQWYREHMNWMEECTSGDYVKYYEEMYENRN